jgi:hypothetical protein
VRNSNGTRKLPGKTYPALGLSLLDRSVKEYYAVRCTGKDLEEIRRYFSENGGYSCIYCGSENATRWDHLIPVSQGGDTVKGNLVPACGSCDDSKQDRSIEEWLSSGSKKAPDSKHAEAIKDRVSRYRDQFGYMPPATFISKLTSDQRAVYARFQAKLSELRETLLSDGIISK